jgi:glycosyltransferase involved in cell wall biosynthesis
MNPYILTICIATYNRADLLLQTLNNIVSQISMFEDVEILVVDGNSIDTTEEVVTGIQSTCGSMRYLKLSEKGGVDKDFDIAVQNSNGQHCWLFTDDDLLVDGAVSKVREAILKCADLVVVNSEICDYNFQRILKRNALQIDKNIESGFTTHESEEFFKLCAGYITFIGAIVIRKSLWVERPRDEFYGSRFIHVGVISTLGAATKVMVLAEPMIRIRLGNAEWSNISFKVWSQLWPDLIWSFPNLSVSCKQAVCLRDPWKSAKFLLWWRALGSYSKKEYLNFIGPKSISLHRIMAMVIAYLPRQLPCAVFYWYATIRQDELMSYHLSNGGKSRNKWFSED